MQMSSSLRFQVLIIKVSANKVALEMMESVKATVAHVYISTISIQIQDFVTSEGTR
jgi:hypothetical protein